jgi:uncharacterized protein (TIGR03083 family)
MNRQAPAELSRDESWQVIEQERLTLADLLATLSDPECELPSLCAGWRIKDVAAHLALAPQPPSLGGMLVAGARAGGRFNRLNHDLAVAHANTPGLDLVTELRHHAASRRLPAVTNYRNILFDVLVHGQDIAVPLGRERAMPLGAARSGAQRVWSMGWPFWAKHRLGGITLSATDTDWSVGRGARVEGPISALLLLVTGRAALDRLAGPGLEQLTERLSPGR